MACCDKSGVAASACCMPPPPAAAPPAASRYPAPPSDEDRKASAKQWARAPAPAQDQFAGYGTEDASDPTPPPYTYSGEYLAACNFPLGSFGTGQVLLCGDGTLKGWTILNNFHAPEYSPLCNMPANFFAVHTSQAGAGDQAFVLQTPANYTAQNRNLPAEHEAHVSAHEAARMQALPGIKSLTMTGRYPVAEVAYDIPGLPVTVELEAMSPLIPGDAKNSSLPVAVFSFKVTNNTTTTTTVDLLQAQQNMVGWDGHSDGTKAPFPYWGGNVNTPITRQAGSYSINGILMSSTGPSAGSGAYGAGTMTIAAVASAAAKTTLISGEASEAELWTAFTQGQAVQPGDAKPTAASPSGASWAGGVVQTVTLAAGTSATVQFVLSWHFPNRLLKNTVGGRWDKILPATLGNRYSMWFKDAADVATYFTTDMPKLLSLTRTYRDIMFSTTLPTQVVETAAGRVACARSPTMWWTAMEDNGVVMGCEGNSCCPLNCSHVYGYTLLLERLWPDLAKDMAYSNFVRNYDPSTGVTMRYKTDGFAIDGALGSVLKAFLVSQQADSKLTWLPTVWPNIKGQMTIVLKEFDDGDGVIRKPQQNTYDSAMNGANTFIGSYYVAALRATAIMATRMGDSTFAEQCSSRAKISSAAYDKICWREDFGYYIADVTAKDCQNSYGPGCFVDQMCGGGLATATGLGYLFTEDGKHEVSARTAVVKNNMMTKPPFQDMQKHFYDGDSGITVCTYPHGKLGSGMKYENLVSSGFTYPVLAGLLFDRELETAMTGITNIRRRQDGRNRSPWNEPECNILYSRAMAGWNLYDQACGLEYDSYTGRIAFDPRWNPTDFSCFLNAEGGWGLFGQTGTATAPQGPNGIIKLASGKATLAVEYGAITVKTVQLATTATVVSVTLQDKPVAATIADGAVTFQDPVGIQASWSLVITLSKPAPGSFTPCCAPSACCPPGANPSSCPPSACPPSPPAAATSRCCPPSQSGLRKRGACGSSTDKGAEAEAGTGGMALAPVGILSTQTLVRQVLPLLTLILFFAAGILVGARFFAQFGQESL